MEGGGWEAEGRKGEGSLFKPSEVLSLIQRLRERITGNPHRDDSD